MIVSNLLVKDNSYLHHIHKNQGRRCSKPSTNRGKFSQVFFDFSFHLGSVAWCPAQVGWPKIGPEYTFSRCIFWRVPLSRHQDDFYASTTLHARFSGVFCYQFEVVHSQTGPSFKEVGGGSEDGGGDEEDEDGGGDAQDVRQQLLLCVFSCRKLTLQSEPWSKDTFTINLLWFDLKFRER